MNGAPAKNLIIRDITKAFGRVTALRAIILEVRQGEFFTLLGPSGWGKTTLLQIVAALGPTTAAVILSGSENTALPAVRRQTGSVFQKHGLFPRLSISENVAAGRRSPRVYGFDARKRAAAIPDLGKMRARRVGTGTLADFRTGNQIRLELSSPDLVIREN